MIGYIWFVFGVFIGIILGVGLVFASLDMRGINKLRQDAISAEIDRLHK